MAADTCLRGAPFVETVEFGDNFDRNGELRGHRYDAKKG